MNWRYEHFRETNFFRPQWYSILINPYFIIRRALFTHVQIFARSVRAQARILDVGCGIKPYRGLFKSKYYLGIDIPSGGHSDNGKAADLFFDGQRIPFPSRQFEAVICTEVLEHSEDPDALMSEIGRVLQDGGLLYLTMPFVYPEHEAPYDFRRFTQYGHKKILLQNGLVPVSVTPTSGVFGVCGQMLSVFVFESIKVRSTFLKTVVSALVCCPLQALALLLDWITRNKWITANYVVIARPVRPPSGGGGSLARSPDL